ncbi:MAG: hypothetical protein K2N28_07065 [Muribaculaceae bacterium]|nr:hypothetical protein [Muribaculaceae bacterium]
MKPVFKLFLSLTLTLSAVSAYCQEVIELDTTAIHLADMHVVSPYFFQHQYLSVIAKNVPEEDGEIFGWPKPLNTYEPIDIGFLSPFKDEEIEVSIFEDEGKKIYVWRFPETEYLREALYMMFVPFDGHYIAYAISIGQWVDWEISISDEKKRATFGRVKKPESAQECFELLKSRGAYTGKITPGEFLQKDYTCPSYRE